MARRSGGRVINLMAGVVLAAGGAATLGDAPMGLPEIEVLPAAGARGGTAVLQTSGPNDKTLELPPPPARSAPTPAPTPTPVARPALEAAALTTPLVAPSPTPGLPTPTPTVTPTPRPSPNVADAPQAPTPAPTAAAAPAAGRAQAAPVTPPQPQSYVFSFKDRPFKEVVEQFAKWKKKPVVIAEDLDWPGGTLTFVSDKAFGLDEAMIELNAILFRKGYTLSDVGDQLVLAKLTQLPRVMFQAGTPVFMSYEEFKKANLPDSTVAGIFHRFSNVEASEIEREYRQFLPDNTMMTVQDGSNRIVITTSAQLLRKWFDFVLQFDRQVDPLEIRSTELYKLKYLPVGTAATIVQQTVIPGLTIPRPPKPGQPPAGLSPTRRVDISRDDRANTLVVVAARDVQNQIKGLLERLDVDPDAGTELRTFKLQHTTADEMVGLMMSALYGEAQPPAPGRAPVPTRRMGQPPAPNQSKPDVTVDSRSNTLLVRAQPAELTRIADFITQWDKVSADNAIQFFPLNVARAPEVVGKIRELFPTATPADLVLSADDRSNTVMVRATGDMLARVKDVIERMDAGEAVPQPFTVTLKYARPSEIAGTLSILTVNVGRQKTMTFQPNDPAGTLVVLATEKDFKTRIEPLINILDNESRETRDLSARPVTITKARAEGIAEILNRTFQGRVPTAKGDVPLTVTPDARTNSVLINSNPAGHALARALIAELDVDRPATALVQTRTYALPGVDVARLAGTVQSQLDAQRRADPGSYAPSVTPDPTASTITVTATDPQLVLIERLINEGRQAANAAKPQPRSFDLRQANAQEVAPAVQSLLAAQAGAMGVAPPVVVPERGNNRLIINASPDLLALADSVIAQMDQAKAEANWAVQVIPLKTGNAAATANTISRVYGGGEGGARLRGLNVRISADPTDQAIVLSGNPDDIAKVRADIEKLQGPSETAKPTVVVHKMRTAYADETAKTLMQLFADPQRPVRLVPDNYAGVLYISARADQLGEINNLLDQIDPTPEKAAQLDAQSPQLDTQLYTFTLKKADPTKVAQTLDLLLSQPGQRQNPKFTPYVLTRQLFVRCTKEQYEEVKKLMPSVDQAEPNEIGTIAIRTLSSGSALALANAVRQAFAGADPSLQFDVVEFNSGGTGTFPPAPSTRPAPSDAGRTPTSAHPFVPPVGDLLAAAATGQDGPGGPPPSSGGDAGTPSIGSGAGGTSFGPSNTPGMGVSGVLELSGPQTPITIAVDRRTNMMFIRATATQIDQIDQMIDLIIKNKILERPEPFFAKLESADPTQVAQMLNQIYGSVSRGAPGAGGRRMPNRGGQPMPQPQPQEAGQTIQADAIPFNAVGDKRTGYVFFRCDPRDEADVRKLISMLDTKPEAAKEVAWEVIQLKDPMDADTTANTVRDMLGIRRPETPITGGDANQRMQIEMQRMQMRNMMLQMGVDPGSDDSNLNASDLTITANATTNSLVVQGPKPMVELVKKVVQELEKQPAPPRPQLKEVKLAHADPMVTAELVNQIMKARQRPGRKPGPNEVPVSVAPDNRGRQLLVTCMEKDWPEVQALIAKLDVPDDPEAATRVFEGLQPAIVQVKYAKARDLQDRLKEIVLQLVMQGDSGKSVLKSQVLSVVADDATNRLIVIASPPMKRLITDVLLPQLDTKDVSPIERRLNWFTLQHASAEDVARQLRELLLADRQSPQQPGKEQAQPAISSDLSTNSVLVFCTPAQLDQVEPFIKSRDVPDRGGGITIVPVRRGRASDLVQQLTDLVNSMSRQGRAGGGQQFTLRADDNTNVLMVSGSPPQVKAVQDTVAALEQIQPASDRQTYVIPTGATDPATVQQVLQQMINQNRPGTGATQRPRRQGTRGPQGFNDLRPAADEDLVDRRLEQQLADGTWRQVTLAQAGDDSAVLAELIATLQPTPTPAAAPAVVPAVALNPDETELAGQVAMLLPTPTPAGASAPAAAPTATPAPRRPAPTPTAVPTVVPTPVPPTPVPVRAQPPAAPPRPLAPGQGRFDLADAVAAAENQETRSAPADLSKLGTDVDIVAAPNGLIIQATPEDFEILQRVVRMLSTDAAGQVELIPLKNQNAAETAALIRNTFVAQPGLGAPPVVVPDAAGNSLIVRGTANQIVQVRQLVQQLDQVDRTEKSLTRTFQVKNSRASLVAGVLSRLFPQQAANRDQAGLNIVADDRTGSIIVKAAPPQLAAIENIITQLDVEPIAALGVRAEVMMIPLRHADVTTLAQTLQNMLRPTAFGGFSGGGGGPGAGAGGPGGGGAGTSALMLTISRLQVSAPGKKLPDIDLEKPIRVIPDTQTNSVYLVSTPENLRVLGEIVALLDTAPLAPGVKVNVRVLEFADATEVVQMLKQLFEQGRRLGQRPGELNVGRVSLAVPDSSAGKALANPVSIVADARTNTVIISGQEDSLALAKLLMDEMDKPGLDKAIPITLLPLRYADASKLAATLTQLLDTRARGTTVSSANAITEKIIVRADARSNTLIISASKPNLEMIQGLVSKLDVLPPMNGQVKLYTLKYATASKVATKIKNLFAAGLNRTETVTDNPEVKLLDKVAIEADDRTKTLVVSTSKENLLIIDDLLRKIDVQDTAMFSDMDTQFFRLKGGDAGAVATQIKTYFNEKINQLKAIRPDAELPFAVFADPRTNTLAVTTTKEVMAEAARIIKEIEDSKQDSQFKVFKLQYATAQALAQTLQKIFQDQQRRLGATAGGFSIEADLASNSIVASMSTSDMAQLEQIITVLDRKDDTANQRTEVFFLKNVKAQQVIQMLQNLYGGRTGGPGGGGQAQAPGSGYTFTQGGTTNSVVVKAPLGELPGIAELIERIDKAVEKSPAATEVRLVKLLNGDANLVVSTAREILGQSRTGGPAAQPGGPNAQTSVNPVGIRTPDGKIVQAVREDITLTPDTRLNAVIIQAPAASADVAEQLVKMLDQETPPAEIQIFRLQNADATKMFETLTKLFNLDSSGRPKPITTGQGGQGQGMWFSDAAAVAALEKLGGPGAGKEQIAVTLDARTNSIIATGTPGYLAVLAQVINDLDQIKTMDRVTRVIPLRNSKAADVVKTVTEMVNQSVKVLTSVGDASKISPDQLLEQQVNITGNEPTNTVVVSASPRRMPEIEQLIIELDTPPPQVMIQTLIAEVTLDDNTELGMDWGFQNLNFTDSSQGTGKGDGQDVIVGTDLGAAGSPSSLGGFNVTITGQDFSFLLRALQTEGRLEVLSRPQIMVADNKPGSISVGESVPFVTNVILGTGTTPPQSQVEYRDIGIILEVTPHINPEGWVSMDIRPEISAISQSQTVVISQGVNAQVFTKRTAETSVNVRDGETIVLGGLITTRDETTESGIPIIKDVPIVGVAARVTRVQKKKTELLIMLTPRVLRTAEDARQLGEQERDLTGLLKNVRRSPLMGTLRVPTPMVYQPASMPADLAPVTPSTQLRSDVIVTPPGSGPGDGPAPAGSGAEPSTAPRRDEDDGRIIQVIPQIGGN